MHEYVPHSTRINYPLKSSFVHSAAYSSRHGNFLFCIMPFTRQLDKPNYNSIAFVKSENFTLFDFHVD
jgi:hypothetical protein